MNKKIFITYGDSSYARSLDRIRSEALAAGVFDKVITYNNSDLPDWITSHMLYNYKRGGGYWLWKPYLCLKTLEECDDTDIVVYSDCGNKIFRHKQWGTYWHWMNRNDAVFFYNGGKMGQWCRKSLINDYSQYVPMLRKMYQIQANFIILKKGAINIVREWLETMMNHPEYVIDATEKNKRDELPEFIENRHDQSVLSAVAFRHQFDTKVLITRQRSERLSRRGQAVFNARISDTMVRNPMHYEPLHINIIRNLLVVPYRNIKMYYYTAINKSRINK